MLTKDILDRFKQKRPVGLLARVALARLLSPDAINEVFHEHAVEQYERKILFSSLMDMMADVTIGLSRSVNAAYRKKREQIGAALSCVCNKLDRVEPQVSQALVRHSYRHVREICNHLRAWEPSDISGYRTKIIDGNHLRGSDRRLKEMRGERAASLPGKSLVVLDPRCRAIQDMFPIEDGHAQERSAFDDVIPTIKAKDLWVADRNFCTHKFMYAIDERKAVFVIRHHDKVIGDVAGKRRRVGATSTGRAYEQAMSLSPYEGKVLKLRRIEIELSTPTRDNDDTVVLLTNIPEEVADAVKIAEIYLGRWRIETAFQTLTTTLRCEVNTLCYPRAALFAFATATVAYNAIAMIEAVIRAEHGREQSEQISKYYMAMEISETHDGMMVMLDETDFAKYCTMPVAEFSAAMRDIASHIDLDYFRKNKRGPKKPVKKKKPDKRKVHVSAAKVLAERK